MNKLNTKQKMLLEAIEWYIDYNKIPPTIKELCELLNCKYPNSIFTRLMVLEKRGYISTKNGKARSIVVLRGIDDKC